jgi:beta-mannan synthase
MMSPYILPQHCSVYSSSHGCTALCVLATLQVLDDSTKQHIRDKVDSAAVASMEVGHPIQVLRRTNRQGFKAGAMSDGLTHVQPLGFKYVAIFDADFEPPW